MNILFIHPNFPAQFLAPCISLAGEGKHDIIFLCQTHYGRNIPGVRKLVLKGRGSHERTLGFSKAEHDRSLYRAGAYREAFESLKSQGWNPDTVISHCGWGCGLYIKDVFPECRFIAYVEWWFSQSSKLQERLRNNPYFNLSEASIRKLSLRNLTACYEMTLAEEIVSPTEWQRQQLPKRLKSKCLVIKDEIDRKLFYPDPKRQSNSPVLTYGTRGMEPMRGFPEFIKSLPFLLEKWPQLRVEVAGTDTVNYGGLCPTEGSWKAWAVNLLNGANLSNRVVWKNRLKLIDYANWLKTSWCHVYLSEPFVTSWSLIEACQCCIPMVATRSPATDEFSHLNPFMIQADHTDSKQLIEAVNDRIRFSARFDRSEACLGVPQQTKMGILEDMSLAAFIADAEAATSD